MKGKCPTTYRHDGPPLDDVGVLRDALDRAVLRCLPRRLGPRPVKSFACPLSVCLCVWRTTNEICRGV
jgi:hypothetical protein